MIYSMFIFLEFEIFAKSRSGAIAEPFHGNCSYTTTINYSLSACWRWKQNWKITFLTDVMAFLERPCFDGISHKKCWYWLTSWQFFTKLGLINFVYFFETPGRKYNSLFFACPNFARISAYSGVIWKLNFLNHSAIDGPHIAKHTNNLDCHHKCLLLIGRFHLPFDSIMVTMIIDSFHLL